MAIGPTGGRNGDTSAFVLVGRSLDARNAQLKALALVFGLGTLVALAAAAAGGFWLAGRALTPIRLTMETQRRFVSDASHELRTPVAVISTNADLLLRHPDDTIESGIEQVAAIHDSATRMGRLVGDLLMLARADEEAVRFAHAEIQLDDIARLVERDMAALAADRGISMAVQATPVTLRGDAERLRQLAVILVDNALKYTPSGGRVVLTCRSEGRRAFLSVQDTGAGIAPEALPHVFERFYRADESRTRSGAGLGLSIAQWIAEAHGGRIAVESTIGRGSTFTVTLPRG